MFYDITSAGYILRIRVTPNSSKNATGGIFTDSYGNDFLKINLSAVPEKGKANQELIKYLSKILNLSKSTLIILSGETDRYKKLQLNISPSSSIEDKLKQLGEQL